MPHLSCPSGVGTWALGRGTWLFCCPCSTVWCFQGKGHGLEPLRTSYFFFFSFWYFYCIFCYILHLLQLSAVLGYSILLLVLQYLLSLLISFEDFYWDISKLRDSFLCFLLLLISPLKAFFISIRGFISLIFIFFLRFSLCLHCSPVLVCCLHYYINYSSFIFLVW